VSKRTTAPRERPIIMSAESVRAILAGRKTQTRRLVKLTRFHEYVEDRPGLRDGWEGTWPTFENVDSGEWEWSPCPYGKPGDRLWVREAFRFEPAAGGSMSDAAFSRKLTLTYLADGAERRCCGGDWPDGVNVEKYGVTRAPMFLPRSLSRLLLEVTTEVRLERLCDISEADARAEGVEVPRCGCEVCSTTSNVCPADQSSYIEGYRSLWESIHGSGSWGNQWVWVATFRRVESDAGKAVAP